MNEQLRIVKTALRTIAPTRAKEIVKCCELPKLEELILIEHDIKHKDLSYVADICGISYSTAKRLHKAGLYKIYLMIQ